jgi:hypothetical protein
MKVKELCEKSTKEEVFVFLKEELGLLEKYAIIAINTYISGDILSQISQNELKVLGFKIGPFNKNNEIY